jgi:hypothetical protein
VVLAPERAECVGMRTNQAVHDHKALLGVVDGLLEEMGLDHRDTGGKVPSPDSTRCSRRC